MIVSGVEAGRGAVEVITFQVGNGVTCCVGGTFGKSRSLLGPVCG